MNELQQQKLQVYGNNWVRNIARLTRRAAELREEGRMTRWRPMLRWEACKERCEEGRRGGRLEEEEKRRREEKLSDEAGWRSWGGGGGQHLKHPDKGKNRKRENLLCVWTIIGLYRDVWIAAIASSRTRLATLTGAMCKTSQCELRSLRVHSGMLNVIRIVTYYTLPPLQSPDSFWIAMAISR